MPASPATGTGCPGHFGFMHSAFDRSIRETSFSIQDTFFPVMVPSLPSIRSGIEISARLTVTFVPAPPVGNGGACLPRHKSNSRSVRPGAARRERRRSPTDPDMRRSVFCIFIPLVRKNRPRNRSNQGIHACQHTDLSANWIGALIGLDYSRLDWNAKLDLSTKSGWNP